MNFNCMRIVRGAPLPRGLLLMKLRLRKRDGRPAPAGPSVSIKFAPGMPVNWEWLKKLKDSNRYSSVFPSVILKDLRIFTSKLLKPSLNNVLRPTVEAFGSPRPSIQCTSFGVTQVSVRASGLRYPVAQLLAPLVGATTARVLIGAFGLPMSGRSLFKPSLFRSKPLRIE